MNKLGKILASATLIIFLFLIIANVSAADLVVNKNTTHSDIDSWMKNSSTVKGNNLIFNTSKYDLTDSINVSKPVNIKSNVNTQINFNKNKSMFYVSASGLTFSGLTLNHNKKGTMEAGFCIINSNSSKSVINFNNMNFNLNNNCLYALAITNWERNVTNSVFKSNGQNCVMIYAENWLDNIYKSTFSLSKFSHGLYVFNWTGNFLNNKIFLANGSTGIRSTNWKGNLHNSNITGNKVGFGVLAIKWTGKASNSIINIKGLGSWGFIVNSSSKGTLLKNKILIKKGAAVIIPKSVKIKNTKAQSSKFEKDIAIVGPRVYMNTYSSYLYPKYLLCKFKVNNVGETKSKTSYLTLKYGKYKKTVKIKPLKSEKSTVVKIKIPLSFKKSKKKIIIHYIDGTGVKTTSKPWIIR